ncbi:LacI family DNA-binding transcriptional regulator [Serratia ureilytica]
MAQQAGVSVTTVSLVLSGKGAFRRPPSRRLIRR